MYHLFIQCRSFCGLDMINECSYKQYNHNTSSALHIVWRQDELKMINETSSGAARKAALCGLLEQEAQLIASVGRHKIVADVENKQKRIQSFLDTVSDYLN